MQKPCASLKLPFEFDKNKLVVEFKTILNTKWIPHFNTGGYNGEWNSIALYAPDGNEENIFAFNDDNSPLIETPILKNCHYLKEVINTFKCQLSSVRLLKLSPGAYIKPHRDFQLGYEDGNFRIHIPIITNPKVEFILNNEKVTMLEGECWYTNVNYVHSVSNNGNNDRIHLVIDGKRNEWSDNLFFSLAPKEQLLKPIETELDFDTIKKTIESLKIMDTPVSRELIKELNHKLKMNKIKTV